MRVQGAITGDGERKYLKVDELRMDFYVSRDEHWPNPGEIAHAYVGFAFAGPLAIQGLS
jgi:hypothetical protein